MRFFTAIKIALAAGVAIAPGVGFANAETQPLADMKAQARALAKMCHSEARQFCASIQPGGGRIIACLEERKAELTEDCRSALAKVSELRAKAAASGTLPQ